MVIDDQLNILPISSHVLNIQPVPTKTEVRPLRPGDESTYQTCSPLSLSFWSMQEELMTSSELELRALKDSLSDTQPVGSIITCAKTLDQVRE